MLLKYLINLISRFGQTLSDAGWGQGMVRVTTTLAVIVCVGLFCWGMYWLVRLILSRTVRFFAKSRHHIGEMLLKRHVIRYTSYLILGILLYASVPTIFESIPSWIPFMQKLMNICVLWFTLRIITGSLWCIVDYQSAYQRNKQKSYKGAVQFATIAVYFVGAIVLLSILLNKSPLVFIGGLGAASAVLMLIFKDSILGLVAGAQLSYNDIVRIGDWITMSKFGADGTVIDITLTTVKVQNFDLTVTTIPAYNLISDSVQNWRSMSDSRHRRIQRSFNIDITGIRFCEPDFIAHLAGQEPVSEFMKPYVKTLAKDTEAKADENRPYGGITNVFLFRRYIEFYLRHHPNIENAPGYTLMVRQLAISDYGLPIQIYCFTRTSDWIAYESIQSDVFDHLLAMAPVFGLSVFERTSQVDARIKESSLPTIGKPETGD
ncbi:MAG: mechanosensitive ion channel family protein [Bacteroides sp.]|nr:mechanosensitive ion channel family protein [Bacteroides sp.]